MLKFRAECFEAYKLNYLRNFLHAPMCSCGCGEKQLVQLVSNEEVFEFCTGLLKKYEECVYTAIFVLAYDNSMFVVVNDAESETEVFIYGEENFDPDFFAEIDAAEELIQYGLIIEVRPNIWKIIEQ